MLRCLFLCYVSFRCVLLCYVVICYVMLCLYSAIIYYTDYNFVYYFCFLLDQVRLYRSMPYHLLLWYVVLRCVILYRIIYCTIVYQLISYFLWDPLGLLGLESRVVRDESEVKFRRGKRGLGGAVWDVNRRLASLLGSVAWWKCSILPGS